MCACQLASENFVHATLASAKSCPVAETTSLRRLEYHDQVKVEQVRRSCLIAAVAADPSWFDSAASGFEIQRMTLEGRPVNHDSDTT